MKWYQLFQLAAIPALVNSLAPTDEPRDADPPQSGYLPNHNISPALLPSYTKKWTMKYNTGEDFFASPLVYTPPNATAELVILVSIQNVVRIINSATGALVISRTLDAPYLSSDSNCNDGATVGITGTPIIDTDTNTLYLFTKGYYNGLPGPQGVINGAYKFWALNLPSLTTVPGYPVLISGPASNDPSRYFIGGTILQRPGLAMIGDSVIAGFGGHCDSMNYTGILVAVSKTPGKGVTDMMAMAAFPGEVADPNLLLGKGGKAGIWQSGMGIAADTANNRVFFVTGNGDAPGANKGPTGPPSPGKSGTSTLEQAIVNVHVDPVTGVFALQDYFSPVNYVVLNNADKDMSSSGLTLLDPATFYGGGVNRVGIAGSKAGVIYVVDADNLGGFKMGPSNTDAVLQEITFTGAHFYSGIGSYPLEGGFIYFCTTGGALQAWKMVLNAQGQPNFAFAAQSSFTLGCHNTPTVTSQNGIPGTAIVWVADTSKGLVAFKAVPNSSVLTQITLPGSGGLTKFHRPVFGNNHVYVTSSNKLIAIGGTAQ